MCPWKEQRRARWQRRHAACGNPNDDPDLFMRRMQDPSDPLGKLFIGGYSPLDIGELRHACPHCRALKYARTAPDGTVMNSSIENVQCCGAHRSIVLPPAHCMGPIPDAMRNIVDPFALNFNPQHYELWKTRSRSLNSSLAFASSQVRECHLPAPHGRTV